MLVDCLPVINFSLKVSVELSTAKSLIEAQNLKITAKSSRSRDVDSPPLTLQTVVVVWSSNIAYNVPRIGDGAALTRKLSCYKLRFGNSKMVKLAIPPHYCQYAVSSRFYSINLISPA